MNVPAVFSTMVTRMMTSTRHIQLSSDDTGVSPDRYHSPIAITFALFGSRLTKQYSSIKLYDKTNVLFIETCLRFPRFRALSSLNLFYSVFHFFFKEKKMLSSQSTR